MIVSPLLHENRLRGFGRSRNMGKGGSFHASLTKNEKPIKSIG
ncbi:MULTISPECIES: hypothetical protein [Pseudomonas aeruginosa group]|nr:MULTISPECIES: hypothetical protein [Pseudomonas aeruginosa group]MCW8026759.1 hypothetical protein [Pseudomonas aeruginosa]